MKRQLPAEFYHLVVHSANKEYCYLNVEAADIEALKTAFNPVKYSSVLLTLVISKLELEADPYGTNIGITSMLTIL